MEVLLSNTPRVIRIGTNGVSTLSNERTPATEDYRLQHTNDFLDQVLE